MEREEKRELLVELRLRTGLNRKDFAIEYDIPYQTITDWELGHRRVPEYLLRLLEYKINLESIDPVQREHKLIILRGNSGSGKTTVAKGLQEKFGANTMLISQDVVRREMLMVKDGADNQALPLMMKLLQYGWEHSRIVILEGIMVSSWYRPLFEKAVSLYGDNIHAFYFDISFEETLRRHRSKPNCNEFGEEAMRRWWREKDYSDVLYESAIKESEQQGEIIRRIYDLLTQ